MDGFPFPAEACETLTTDLHVVFDIFKYFKINLNVNYEVNNGLIVRN